ncbi:MAG: SUMF1/EgtB/PvdO family nonheme iron enzyme [Deltaproteobacteria bacterium]|nr:SUMF1/EgtB/PvdO family nonheme iron enzyme [Deltaproteobacteria bacterium]
MRSASKCMLALGLAVAACSTMPSQRNPAYSGSSVVVTENGWEYHSVTLPPVTIDQLREMAPQASPAQLRGIQLNIPKEAHYWRAPQLTGAPASDANEPVDPNCPLGMVDVRGDMKVDSPTKGPIEQLQRSDQVCKHWLGNDPTDFARRCAQFSKTAWEKIAQDLATEPMKPFCIDRYEYPNKKGASPAIDVSWYEAIGICGAEGKRLCTEDEWTFACEGEAALPYPYGYERSDQKCNIDKAWLDFTKEKLTPRDQAAGGLAKLWKGEPSGTYDECVSPFKVHDMTGNVDEWTVSKSVGINFKGTEVFKVKDKKSGAIKDRVVNHYPSVLKGGYWSTVRDQCRPATGAHDETTQFYQMGFRCCK